MRSARFLISSVLFFEQRSGPPCQFITSQNDAVFTGGSFVSKAYSMKPSKVGRQIVVAPLAGLAPSGRAS
jgi:hypothetical protein